MTAIELDLKRRVSNLEEKAERLEYTLTTLIIWMAGSANSPIRIDEAEKLTKMLKGKD